VRSAIVVVALCGCLRTPPFPGVDDAPSGSDDAATDAMADASQAPANIMFVTSTTTSVDTMGGLAGADAFCMARAAAAGLPGTFVAWLSAGLMGAKTRLGTARGWLRTDGKPFADEVADLAAGVFWYPPRFDEFGVDAGPVRVMTGTKGDGTADNYDCTALTGGTAEGIETGLASSTHRRWTFDQQLATCASQNRIYCFQTDLQVPVKPIPVTGRKAFLSSAWTPSNGLPGADAKCAADATSANLTGTFKALLSTSFSTAASRFDGSGQPWVRVDGVPLAPTAAAVLAGTVDTTLEVDATGAYVDDDVTWTGVSSMGTPGTVGTTTGTCTDWTATTGSGGMGLVHESTARWFSFATSTCTTTTNRLYCFELGN
jgi:hypothetical protein